MHPGIRVSSEGRRGCGYRKTGGIYLVFDGPAGECGKLPVPLTALNVCPHCGKPLPGDFGVRPSRAPRMLANPELLWRDLPCHKAKGKHNLQCINCPLSNGYETGPALLLWIGESYYPDIKSFTSETAKMGISRRISQVPKGFIVGETWVLLAHVKGIAREIDSRGTDDQPLLIPGKDTVWEPAVFGMFRPQRIEVVVTGNEPDEEIDALIKRGLSPVVVQWAGNGEAESDEDGDDEA